MQKIPSEWFLTQCRTLLTKPLDRTKTTVFVEAALDNNEKTLFEIGDIITCDFESMKVTGIDEQNNILTVERGFGRILLKE